MPEPNTKYNYITKLQKDLSNNSFIFPGANHILTCDLSDTLIENIETAPYKVYLESRAKFYMHPFSQVSNCNPNIDNSKTIYKTKIPARVPIQELSSLSPILTQKKIQNQVNSTSTLYSTNLTSLTVANEIDNSNTKSWNNASDRIYDYKNSNHKNKGVDIKHNSYDRFLARKKSQYLKTETSASTSNNVPLYGNKTRKFSMVLSNRCVSC